MLSLSAPRFAIVGKPETALIASTTSVAHSASRRSCFQPVPLTVMLAAMSWIVFRDPAPMAVTKRKAALLFVFAQLRAENRCALFLELVQSLSAPSRSGNGGLASTDGEQPARDQRRLVAIQITWRAPRLPCARVLISSTTKPACFRRRVNPQSGPCDQTASTPPGFNEVSAAARPDAP